MPNPRVFRGDFVGLQLEDSSYASRPSEATEAVNCYVKAGNVVIRPGRRELAENQGTATQGLGVANYIPPDQSIRSVVFVTTVGVFQRQK
jgi:hypothetical protein